jgi:hypothetical protein
LKAISLGKFNHGLYHNDRLSYASILGGIMSLIIVALIIGYGIILIIPIQRGSEYLTATEIRDLMRSPYFDAIKFQNFYRGFITSVNVTIYSTENCTDLRLEISSKDKGGQSISL